MTEIPNFKGAMHEINTSKGLALRTLTTDDVHDRYVAWMNDPEITKYTEQRYHHHSFDDVQAFVEAKLDSPNEILFGIFYQNQHIGNIKLGQINLRHLTADLSYFIGDRDCWGAGLASSAIDGVVGFAFTTLKLHKLNAGCYEENIGSIKVLSKNGFQLEGTFQDQIMFEGRRINALFFGRRNVDLS
ncbi:MAG: GNAT family N-acetyltransferase [Alphaproteobacteria bacterium]|nr:GNAT family N-acetyltransferase [Alphaproteobacteria bacterium]